MRGFGVQALVVAAGVLLGLLMAGAGHGKQGSPEIWVVLRCAGAVALVACAVVVTGLAVRAVSARRVHRGKHDDDYDEPPLPRYRPEPEPEDEDGARTAIPQSRMARPVPLPGRAPVPLPSPRRTLAPDLDAGHDVEEVSR
jgi:cell division septation protein DedD